MTGILPIKKDGSQSAISDFGEYTMLEPEAFAEYVGFTEDEVKRECSRLGKSFDRMKMAYISCVDQYAKVEELPSSHGLADLAFIPKRRSILPAMIVELKWNKTSPIEVTVSRRSTWARRRRRSEWYSWIVRPVTSLKDEVSLRLLMREHVDRSSMPISSERLFCMY